MATNTGYLRSAADAVNAANKADSEGSCEEAVALFNRALNHYRSAAHCERNEEARCLITEQAKAVMARIGELLELLGPSNSDEEEHEKQERRPHKPKREEAQTQAGGEDHFHEQLRALKLSGDQLSVVRWESIIGLDQVKEQLLFCTKLPLEMPHLFTGGLASPSSILLYGPPGVGKTQIVRALAHESGFAFFTVSTASLISKYVGDSAKYVKALFEVVKEAKPCILFIDEIDALCPDRESGQQNGESTRAVGEFLVQCDGITREDMSGVLLVGATNLPWRLDSGVLRRLARRFYVPLPTLEGRFALFRHYTSLYPSEVGPALEDTALWQLAEQTPHYSGADIAQLVKSAYQYTVAQIPKAEHFKPVRAANATVYIQPAEASDSGARPILYNQLEDKARLRPHALSEEHLRRAIGENRPSVDPERVAAYEEWTTKHGTGC
jgi:vacuolar protein-sorting-associated protein 4